MAGVAVLLVMAGVALPMYAEFGEGYLGLMEDMPEWLRVVYGESMGSVAGLVGMAMFTLVSPLVLLVYAIAMGSGAAVGEEEGGTLALLLANPVSRGHVLLAKAAVAIIGVLLIVVAVWLGIERHRGARGHRHDGPGHRRGQRPPGGAGAALRLAGAGGERLDGIVSAGPGRGRHHGRGVLRGQHLAAHRGGPGGPGAPLALAPVLPVRTPLRRGVDPALLAIALAAAAALFAASFVGLRRRDLRV